MAGDGVCMGRKDLGRRRRRGVSVRRGEEKENLGQPSWSWSMF